MSRNRHR